MSEFPNLRRATSMIANDIGTPPPQDELQIKLTNFLSDFNLAPLREIDAWLGSLSPGDFETVCIGEHKEMLLVSVLAPAGTDAMLDLIAEQVC